jgi:hypothetical protein
VWPELTAPALLTRLYADPEFLAASAGSLLDADEVAALFRPAPRSSAATRWTPADAVLLDELDALLRPNETYVHAVVDEAQDLSAMQCRAVARRCPSGSMTVLGDLAQATTPWAPGDWSVTLRHLGNPLESGTQLRALTAGYRVPEEVLQFANRLLPYVAADVPSATSVRHGADALRITRASPVSTEVRRCLAADGSVGVIVADPEVGGVLAALQAAGIDAHPLDADLDARVEVVAATQAKGLEFDSVIVVEPAQIVAAEHHRVQGLRRLYVALTRAVSRLSIVHEQPLPTELGS